MLINQTIIRAACEYIREHKVGPQEADRIHALVEEYQSCCGLSIGKDEKRSAYWHAKAGEARERLCSKIGYCQEACCR